MQIVIDIEEAIYKECIPYKDTPIISNLANYNSDIVHAVANGTPLPDGAEILTKDAYSDLCRRAADVPENARKRTKTHACVCISRQAAIDAIRNLPPVEPERKLGKWLLLSDDEVKKNVGFWPYCSTAWMNYKCSSCGKIVHNSLKGHEENRTRYCHNCGTKMEVNG